MSSDNKKTTGERKNKLEELAAKRREENEEDVDKLKNKPKSATSTPSSSKATTPIKASKVPKQPPPSAAKAKGVKPPRQDQYEVDGFIVDDENEEVGEESETGSDDVMSGELSVSESSGSGSEDDKKKKKKGNPKQKNITKNKQKKRTTKRKKDEDSDDDDDSEDDLGKKSKKKRGGSDSEELDSEKEKNDLMDDLEAINTEDIIKERRTRGKKIDFRGMDPDDDE